MKKGKLSVAGAALCAALLICSQASAAALSKADKPDKKPPKPEPVPNQLLVSFKSGASSSDIAALHSSAKGKVLKKISRIGVELVELPAGSNLADAIKTYKKDPRVAFAEPNYRRVLTAVPPPNEGSLPDIPNLFTEQWHLHNTGQGFGEVCTLDMNTWEYVCESPLYWGAPDADIDILEGWELTKGSADIKIAVLDSGVECSHPDLSGKCFEQINFSSSSSAADFIGHGTHVASIAAANTDNSIGTAGVAWNAQIGSLKVCSEVELMPKYYLADCQDGDLAEAIIYAADQGYQVINMSLAGPEDSAVIRNAVEYAWSKGAVLVAGAGNNYDTVIQYPAGYSNVISVASTDHYDNLSSFSTFSKDWVSVAAPGGALSMLDGKGTILAAVPKLYCDGIADCYDRKSGTSMATPVVSGIAAMVRSYLPNLTNAEVRECIEISAERTGALGQDFLAWTKNGRVNLYNALQCVPDIENEKPTALFNAAIAGLKVDFTDRSFDKDGTIAAWSWEFGDDGTSIEQNSSHTYAAAGKYTVKLTVTDNRDGVSHFTNEVEVSEPDETCVDTDGDGVPDATDKCDNTPANTPVNSKGCPVKPKVIVVPVRG